MNPNHYRIIGPDVQVNDIVYFVVQESNLNDQLWRTDGSEAGTWMVKDINAEGPAHLSELIRVGNQIFFTAVAFSGGARGLWVSDGTEDGTHLLKEIEPWQGQMAVVNETLIFAAEDERHGNELWQSDGTVAGTKIVANLSPDDAEIVSTSPRALTAVGYSLYFAGRVPDTNRRGVWRTTPLAIDRTPQSASVIAEQGGTAVYTVTPTAPPKAPLTIELTADSQTTVSPTTLVFTPENWHEAQTVTITAVDDAVAEGRHSSTITHTIASEDNDYVVLGSFSYLVAIIDNETNSLTSYLPTIQRGSGQSQ